MSSIWGGPDGTGLEEEEAAAAASESRGASSSPAGAGPPPSAWSFAVVVSTVFDVFFFRNDTIVISIFVYYPFTSGLDDGSLR